MISPLIGPRLTLHIFLNSLYLAVLIAEYLGKHFLIAVHQCGLLYDQFIVHLSTFYAYYVKPITH